MLQRDAYSLLQNWKSMKTHQGLLVSGARQVGKTTLIREFAKANYHNVAEINFLENRRAVELVSQATDTQDLLLRLSALAGAEFKAHDTLVFFDEIQECEDVLTWLKFLVEATDYDYVLSGSLLGIDLYNVRSFPVGFVQEIQMYPLTFREFCRASGVADIVLKTVQNSFKNRTPTPDYMHSQLIDLFYKYLIIGGMPDAVNVYVGSMSTVRVRNVQRAIFNAYEADITKYVKGSVDRRHIKTIYESIPNQLNAQNKRFKYTKINRSARFSHMVTAFDWLENAGIALPVLRVQDPVYPLGGSADMSSFKLFMSDTGLLTSRLMGDVDIDILDRRSTMNYGSIFENVVAQELKAAGFDLFYYNKSGIGEIDFMVQNRMGDITLIEVKSGKDYKRHNAMNNLLATKNYRFKDAIVFHDGNVEVEKGRTYLPIYMVGMLGE